MERIAVIRTTITIGVSVSRNHQVMIQSEERIGSIEYAVVIIIAISRHTQRLQSLSQSFGRHHHRYRSVNLS